MTFIYTYHNLKYNNRDHKIFYFNPYLMCNNNTINTHTSTCKHPHAIIFNVNAYTICIECVCVCAIPLLPNDVR